MPKWGAGLWGLSSGDADGWGGWHAAGPHPAWGMLCMQLGSPKPPLTFPGRRRLQGFQGQLTWPHPFSRRTWGRGFAASA